MFGYHEHNFLAHCGPNLIILGPDRRTERNVEIVQDEKTWDIIFDELDKDLENIEHLSVLFPVPFSFVRFRIAESILERLKNDAFRSGNVPLIKQTNFVFSLSEPYDDLLDEWTHKSHIGERNYVLQRFQIISQEKKVRITFFSGDVHCCGVSLKDTKLMYQIISSTIVNTPSSKI